MGRTPRIKGKIGKDMDRGAIWVGDIGAYNAGHLIGEWIKLPSNNLQKEIDKILKKGRKFDGGEEFFIADYELPFEIGEYTNPHLVNEVIELLDDTDMPDEIFSHVVDHVGGIEDLLDDPDVLEEVHWLEDINNHRDLAYAYVEMEDFKTMISKKDMDMYFDWEKYGRDLEIGGDADREDYGVRDYDDLAVEFLGDEPSDTLDVDTLEQYFDYASFGRDLELNGSYDLIDGGYAVERIDY